MDILVICLGNKVIKKVELKDVITLGKSPQCDVLLEGREIMPCHAKIEKKNGNYVIIDLDTPYGIFVNAERIKEKQINPKDIINIGQYSLFIESKEEKTEVKETTSLLESKERLRVIKGENVGQIYSLKDGLTIGRDSENTIVLSNLSVSRVHARISISEDSVKIIDLGTCNGTKVNNKIITRHILLPGDKIEIGGTIFVYESEGRYKKGPFIKKKALALIISIIVIVTGIFYFFSHQSEKQRKFNAHWNAAENYLKEEKLKDALAELYECKNLQPQNAKIIEKIEYVEKLKKVKRHIEMGQYYLNANIFEIAEEEFKKAEEIMPSDEKIDALIKEVAHKKEYMVKINNIITFIETEKYDEALKECESLFSIYGRTDELRKFQLLALERKSSKLRESRKYKEAMHYYDKILEIEPTNENIRQQKKQIEEVLTKPKVASNRPPIIRELRAESKVINHGESIKLYVKALDPDGDYITYSWRAESGKINPINAETVTYQAPMDGTSDIVEIKVTDRKGYLTTQKIVISFKQKRVVPPDLLEEVYRIKGRAKDLEKLNPKESRRLFQQVMELLSAYPDNEYYIEAKKIVEEYEK